MGTSQRQQRCRRPNVPGFSAKSNAEDPRRENKRDDGEGNCNGVPKHLVNDNAGAHVPVVVRRARLQSFDNGNNTLFLPRLLTILLVYANMTKALLVITIDDIKYCNTM